MFINVIDQELKELFGLQISEKIASENRLQLPVKYVWAAHGVYVFHNPQEGRLKPSILKNKNTVAYVSKRDISLGSMSVEELADSPLVRATFGKKGSVILSKIANYFQDDPFIFGYNVSDNGQSTLSGLALDIPFAGRGLIMHADQYNDSQGYNLKKFNPLN